MAECINRAIKKDKEFDMELFLSICEKYGLNREDIFKNKITATKGDIVFLSKDNVCNYHINDKDKLVICGCTQEPIASTFSWFNEQTSEYKYCPYCGKEIQFI